MRSVPTRHNVGRRSRTTFRTMKAEALRRPMRDALRRFLGEILRQDLVSQLYARRVGLLGVELGIGRTSLDSRIDHSAGFIFHRKTGDRVGTGEIVAEVFASDAARAEDVAERLADHISYAPRAGKPKRLILDRLENRPRGEDRSHFRERAIGGPRSRLRGRT
ncbi:MAG: hypothetical protein ABIK44_03205 [candidate division WOR-3 bacterium]